MILFYDTETTGLVNRYRPPEDPSQPHLVQLAALLTEDDGTERSSINFIVNPGQNVVVPDQASNVHGITTELARRAGVTCSAACEAFNALARKADLLVCHNVDFDQVVMSAEMYRCDANPIRHGRPHFCTMKAATPICKIPHANPRGPEDYKWPRLEECVRHFFDEELIGAHDALVDVRACARVYFHLKELQQPAPLR